MAIVRTADKIREYNKAFKTLKNDSITPYASDAEEKYIKKFLGKTLYAALDAYVGAGATGDDEYDALLPYVERASSRFTLYMASTSLDINLGDTGFTTANTQNLSPASKERVARYTMQLIMMGYENIETMLEFLEENQDDYPLWVASDAYTLATTNFIRRALEFDELVTVKISRMIFQHIRPQMDNIETFRIETTISEELSDEILQQIDADCVSVLNQKLLKFIKPAVANLVVANVIAGKSKEKDTSVTASFKDLQREQYSKLGEFYIMEIQKILDANPDDYPLYTASDLYNEDKTSNDMYEISEDDKVLGMGAIPLK